MIPPAPVPGVYFGGSSPAAGPVAARYADAYLTWGERPDQVAQKIAWIRGLAEAEGRTLRFGIRLHVISRDSARDAWAEASRLLDGLDPGEIANAQRVVGQSEEVAERIAEYASLGIEEFIFSGCPHLEEAYWFGEGVMPELRRHGAAVPAAAVTDLATLAGVR